MVHCGYEPSAVDHTFASFGGLWSTVKAMLFTQVAPGVFDHAPQVVEFGAAELVHPDGFRTRDVDFDGDVDLEIAGPPGRFRAWPTTSNRPS